MSEQPEPPLPFSAPARAARDPATTAWSVAGLVLLLTAAQLPFVTAAKFGHDHDGRMFSGAVSLWTQGQGALALLVTLCGFGLPLVVLALAAVLGAGGGGRLRPGLFRLARTLDPWSMPEVRVLAIIVAFTKLSALVEAAPAAGLGCYAAAALCTLLATRRLSLLAGPDTDEPSPAPPPRAPAKCAALALAAACLLVPAYTLPVMSFAKVGQAHADTLFASVAKLWHAHLWGIAAIVFTASLVVPVFKLLALAVLLAATRRPDATPRPALGRLHAVVHGIGRWSMLDVFLVAFLCGIVEFGELAQIEARAGVLAFAGAVVLTMLATASFDPRRLDPTPTTLSP